MGRDEGVKGEGVHNKYIVSTKRGHNCPNKLDEDERKDIQPNYQRSPLNNVKKKGVKKIHRKIRCISENFIVIFFFLT